MKSEVIHSKGCKMNERGGLHDITIFKSILPLDFSRSEIVPCMARWWQTKCGTVWA